MQEHPIPQDVTGYKFHIVGNMTLGQFVQLAAGAVLAFIIYSTNLYDIIKWPLMLLVFGLGAMTAFVPIGERPISHWLTTFAKILYKPTQFFWRREPVPPDFFNFVSSSSQSVVLPELDLTPLRRQKIHEYIVSAEVADDPDPEVAQVRQYVDHISSLFNSATSQTEEVVTQVQRPKLKVRLRSMRAQPSTPINQELAVSQPTTSEMETDTFVPSPGNSITQVSHTPKSTQLYTQQQNMVGDATPPNPTSAAGDTVPIPEEVIPEINSENTTVGTESPAPITPPIPPPQVEATTLTQTRANQVATNVTYNKALPFPSKPTVPNKLVGMILSTNNELLEGAIVEIRIKGGAVARAVRSNALGQFFITTPLANGDYIINVDKEGYQFEPLAFTLKGKIVEPIEIHSL